VEIFRLPQELEDQIFLYLDYFTLVECRHLQSEFVKTTTQYHSPRLAVLNGHLKNLKWITDKNGRIRMHKDIFRHAAYIMETFRS
jgi:hypothetical protein